jgi:flagella basal body P-ring formation protein FlgA
MRAPILPLLLLLAAPADAATIRVAGPRVLLTDVLGAGAVEGDLGPAPSPGLRRRVYRQQVIALLGAPSARRLPPFWQIETRAQSLSCAELTRRASAALGAGLPAGLSVESLSCGRPLLLPVGELQLTARLVGDRRAGRVAVQISVQAGQWPARVVSASATIDGQVPALVAAADLEAGALLTASTVRVERHRASALPSDAVAALDELVGKKLALRLRAGTILRRGNLVAVPIVRRGATVTISVNANGMRLTSRGVAREDGVRDDTINVLCSASNRLLKARVAEPNLVVVDL